MFTAFINLNRGLYISEVNIVKKGCSDVKDSSVGKGFDTH
jgi:hypothetical protein